MRYAMVFSIGCIMMLMMMVGSGKAEPAVDDLQQRINRLEQEVQELKALLREQQKTQQEEQVRIQKIEQEVVKTGAERAKIAEQAPGKSPRRFQFKPYGSIKLDASYDDSRTNYGNFVIFVPNESAHKNDNEFNMTARQTRLGLNIIAPEFQGWNAAGRLEIDFYGDGATQHENKPEPMLRHAVITLARQGFSLLAGQTSDLISPLCPSTLNYTVAWGAGNIGYRRAQLRLTQNYQLTETSTFTMAVAAARSTGTLNEDLDLDIQNDGEDAGFPSFQARIGLETPLFNEKKSAFGVSGHWGKEEVDWENATNVLNGRQERVKSWSINGDVVIPFTPCLELKGEAFVGYNLDDYFGGVLQGVNVRYATVGGMRELDSVNEVKTVGGWAQLTYKQTDQWTCNGGFGIDDPRNDDLSAGMRSRNTLLFVNVLYKLIPPVTLGLEYSYWDTEYINKSSGTDNRVQGSVIYSW